MIYLQPQFRTPSGEILNVVSNDGKLLGYLFYMFKEESDMYIIGQLDEVGEKQNYIDLVSRFISGLKEACALKQDPYVKIKCGGEEIDIKKQNEEDQKENG